MWTLQLLGSPGSSLYTSARNHLLSQSPRCRPLWGEAPESSPWVGQPRGEVSGKSPSPSEFLLHRDKSKADMHPGSPPAHLWPPYTLAPIASIAFTPDDQPFLVDPRKPQGRLQGPHHGREQRPALGPPVVGRPSHHNPFSHRSSPMSLAGPAVITTGTPSVRFMSAALGVTPLSSTWKLPSVCTAGWMPSGLPGSRGATALSSWGTTGTPGLPWRVCKAARVVDTGCGCRWRGREGEADRRLGGQWASPAPPQKMT